MDNVCIAGSGWERPKSSSSSLLWVAFPSRRLPFLRSRCFCPLPCLVPVAVGYLCNCCVDFTSVADSATSSPNIRLPVPPSRQSIDFALRATRKKQKKLRLTIVTFVEKSQHLRALVRRNKYFVVYLIVRKNIVFTVHIVGNLNSNRSFYETIDVHVTENSTSPRYNIVNIIIHLLPAIRSARLGNSSLIIVIVFT